MDAARLVRCCFYGISAEVFTTEDSLRDYPSCPWMFRIHKPTGGVIQFAGMPNRCVSKQSARMRCKWRCKWIKDGTFDEKYKEPTQ